MSERVKLQLGEVICTLYSPVPEETCQSYVSMIKHMYSQTEEKNRKAKESMESQLEAHFISYYQTRLLFAMDLERN